MSNPKFRSNMTVEVVSHNLSDEAVARAARVSTIGGTHDEDVDVERDRGLINFLMRERHGSPFEHGSITFYVEAPIFVAREHFRHRAGWSYNETSGRYRELEPVFYLPGLGRKLVQVGKPGRYEFVEGDGRQRVITERVLRRGYTESYIYYEALLAEGVAKEIARSVLPVGLYTSYYATCNARSLMHFLSLRTMREGSTFPSYPQREIEMIAEMMEYALGSHAPHTYEAFNKHGRVAP